MHVSTSIAAAVVLIAGVAGSPLSWVTASISSDASFEVDGDLVRTASQDWFKSGNTDGSLGVLKADGTSAVNAVLITDDVKTDATTFPGGAKESDPSGWLPVTTSQVTPKTDITNVYAFGKSVGSKPYIFNAMERLPKAGDVHLDFEYNAVVEDGIPVRQAGDVLVAYDLGGSRNNNTGAISVRVYLAGTGGTYDYAHPTAEASGANAVSAAGVDAVLNTAAVPSGPWGTFDAGGNSTTADIPAFSFGEAGIDLVAATGNSAPCFNWVTVKSRSSESVTSQLKDTTGPRSFPFCGGLDVKKFIDYDADGVRDTALDGDIYGATTEPFVAGWEMTVQSGTVNKCSTPANTAAQTSGDPRLSCTRLPSGSYTVTETQKDGYVKTSPAGTSLSQSVTVGTTTTATAVFGNACLVAVTFTVTGVPDGQTPFAYYYLNGSEDRTDVVLTQGVEDEETAALESETWSAVVDDVFLDSSSMAWGYGVGDNTVEAEDAYDFSGSGVPDGTTGLCTLERSVEFAPSNVTGLKFKDINMNGVQDAPDDDESTPDEVGLGGFTFRLVDPEDTTDVLYEAVSCGTTDDPCGEDANGDTLPTGTYVFSDVPAGSYLLVEALDADGAPAGWSKVGIAVADTDDTDEVETPGVVDEYAVSVVLGEDTDVPAYGNTPLSKIRVELQPGTDPAVTKISDLVCETSTGAEEEDALTMTESEASEDLDFLSEDVRLGTYVCTLTIVDP